VQTGKDLPEIAQINKDNIYFIGLKVSVFRFRLVSGDAHRGGSTGSTAGAIFGVVPLKQLEELITVAGLILASAIARRRSPHWPSFPTD
jgi:hypothetical protein